MNQCTFVLVHQEWLKQLEPSCGHKVMGMLGGANGSFHGGKMGGCSESACPCVQPKSYC